MARRKQPFKRLTQKRIDRILELSAKGKRRHLICQWHSISLEKLKRILTDPDSVRQEVLDATLSRKATRLRKKEKAKVERQRLRERRQNELVRAERQAEQRADYKRRQERGLEYDRCLRCGGMVLKPCLSCKLTGMVERWGKETRDGKSLNELRDACSFVLAKETPEEQDSIYLPSGLPLTD